MRKMILCAIVLGIVSGAAIAEKKPKEKKPAEIKLRDAVFKGMMRNDTDMTLTVKFDVRKEDLFDEMVLDFYILLEPDEEEQGLQFFHARTIHRFLRKKAGYESAVIMPLDVVKCINPNDSEYAVVLTHGGKEVAVESSTKNRWWEDKELGPPIENLLYRSGSGMIIREWETK